MKSRLIAALFTLVFTLGLTHAALADSVLFTLNNPTQSVARGGTISYSATVTAPLTNTGSEYLNGLSFNINPGNLFTIDSDSFFNNYPFFLAAGQSYTGTLFTLTAPLNSSIGTFLGSVVLQGGPANSQGTIGTQSFSASVTPEPSSWALLATGMVGVFVFARRRQGDTASFRA